MPRAEKMKPLLLETSCSRVYIERLASTLRVPQTLLFGRRERAETLGRITRPLFEPSWTWLRWTWYHNLARLS